MFLKTYEIEFLQYSVCSSILYLESSAESIKADSYDYYDMFWKKNTKKLLLFVIFVAEIAL